MQTGAKHALSLRVLLKAFRQYLHISKSVNKGRHPMSNRNNLTYRSGGSGS
jgi:hypothetical protein